MGSLGNSGGFPPGKVNGRPRRCPLRGFGLQTASCDRICYHGCPNFSHPSGHKQSISPAPPPLGAAVGGGGAGEDLDWPWGRSVGTGDGVQPGNPRATPAWFGRNDKAQVAESPGLQRVGMTGPFGVSTGDLGAAWRSICPSRRWRLLFPHRGRKVETRCSL